MADNKQGASQASQMNELPRLRRLSDDRTHTLNELNVIGRHIDCDLYIDDEKGVSRKHARLTVEDGVVHLEDLGSLNGTLINGNESEGKQALVNGDILIFDEQEYELFVPYEDINEFDPSMTVIADRSAFKKRMKKKSEEKKKPLTDTAQPMSPSVDAAFSDQKAANHTIIDQPRMSVAKPMRIVDEDFLREVHDDEKEIVPDEPQPTLPIGAVRESFDVSDDEVEEILHAEAPVDALTRFVADERSSVPDSPRVGSAPFLSRNESMQSDSTEAAAFTRGSTRSATPDDAHLAAAPGVMHAQLIVLDGGRHSRLSLSGDQTSWNVGSAVDADLLVAQQGVAADHAIILREGSTWTLCDRGSEGGCTVNGHTVNVARIQLGDRLSFGSAECLFAAAEDEQPRNLAPAHTPMAELDPFDEDPMDTPQMRVDIPMDDSIWDEHEQQLYRDTSRDQILRARRNSSRHEPENNASPHSGKPSYASWEPPADYGRSKGLTRFLPAKRTIIIVVLGVVAVSVLGALAYLVI